MKYKCEHIISSKGFTLIEVITTLAIMGILMSMLYSLFFSGAKTYEISYDSYRSQNEARIAMSFITVKIRQNDSLSDKDGAMIHDISVEQEEESLGRKCLKVSDGTTEQFIYKLGGANGYDLMVSGVPFESVEDGGSVVAEDLSDIIFSTSTTATGAESIEIVIRYNDGQDELKETITLRTEAG